MLLSSLSFFFTIWIINYDSYYLLKWHCSLMNAPYLTSYSLPRKAKWKIKSAKNSKFISSRLWLWNSQSGYRSRLRSRNVFSFGEIQNHYSIIWIKTWWLFVNLRRNGMVRSIPWNWVRPIKIRYWTKKCHSIEEDGCHPLAGLTITPYLSLSPSDWSFLSSPLW